jgi:replicative DNA helicase
MSKPLRKPNRPNTDLLPAEMSESEYLIEMAILSCCLHSEEHVTVAEAGLPTSGQVFRLSKNQIIWEAIKELHQLGIPIDLFSMTKHLKEKGLLDKAGGLEYLYHLTDVYLCGENLEWYLSQQAEVSKRMSLVEMGKSISEGALNGELSMEDLEERVELLIRRVEEKSPVSIKNTAQQIATTIAQTKELIHSGNLGGIPTGLPSLDYLIGGLLPRQMMIVAGRPSMGKSALAFQIATHVALRENEGAIIFSCEMNYADVWRRIICGEAKINAHQLLMGDLDHRWDDFETTANALANTPLIVDDSANITISYIEATCRTLVQKKFPLKLVVVDYIQYMIPEGHRNIELREREIAEFSRSLKHIASELNVSLIAVSQLNRSVESRATKRPLLSDLRESGAIEQDADIVLAIYRPSYYEYNSPDEPDEIIVLKHRNGPVGTAKVRFNPNLGRFFELDAF